MDRYATTRLALALALMLPAAATPAAPGTDDDTWVYQGRIYDGGVDGARDAMVVVEGGVIACVAAPGGCDAPPDAPRIASKGATLMPGLVDLHVHARPHYAPVFVRGGVTSVRDANNTLPTLEAVAAAPGAPRVFGSGPMLDGPASVIIAMSEHAGPPGAHLLEAQALFVIETGAQAEQAVDLLAEAGVSHVKLYETLSLDAFRAAVARAHVHGLPVMADLGTAMTRGLDRAQVDAMQAAEAGVDSIEHASGVALAYRRLGGDPLAGDIDMALLDRIATTLVEAGTTVVPTLVGPRNMAADAFPETGDYPLADTLDAGLLGWWRQLHGSAAPKRAAWQRDAAFVEAFMRRFIALGGRVGAGTDVPALPMVVPGDALRHEVGLLAGLGLSPVQALHAATGGAARLVGSDDIGRIEAGRRADLLLVHGDPTEDVTVLGDMLGVWLDGVRRVDAAPVVR